MELQPGDMTGIVRPFKIGRSQAKSNWTEAQLPPLLKSRKMVPFSSD